MSAKSELVAYTEVSFLVGDDQLSGFHRWFEARKILKTVNLIVVRRSQDTDFDELINSLSKNLISSTRRKIMCTRYWWTI